MICTCKYRKLSHTFKENGQLKCRNCGLPVKCEAEFCDNIATEIYVSYAVCSEHLEDAKKVYLQAGLKGQVL